MPTKLKIAIIGAGKRGMGLLEGFLIMQNDIDITYVCDLYPDRAQAAAEKIRKVKGDNPKAVTDYSQALADPDVQAVIVSSSWDSHISAAIAAMKAKKATAMEVGGAYSIEECWELVKTYEQTLSPFMFLENCCYNRDELLALKMAREGLFGEIVHCSGAYAHDLREEVSFGKEKRHYRLSNYLHRNGENYPTHELGPIAKILDINRGNRMLTLVSVASKAAGLEQYVKDNAEKLSHLQGKKFMQGDIIDTVIRCSNGATIRLKLDTTLPGYYDRELTVKGTKGMYSQTSDMVIIDGIDNKEEYWAATETVAKLGGNAKRYEHLLPDCWKNMTEEDKKTGHGGMDGIILREFIDRVKDGREMPLDVYDAASWMAVTCLSEQSVALNGAPVHIPDFTNGKWINRPRFDVL